MITLNIRFFNILAAYTGKKALAFAVPTGTNLSDSVVLLAGQFNPAFQDIVLSAGAPSQHLRIFLNGEPVGEKDMKTVLKDGDEIMLFPAVAGG